MRLRAALGVALLAGAPTLFAWTTFQGRLAPGLLTYLMLVGAAACAAVFIQAVAVMVFDLTAYAWLVAPGLAVGVLSVSLISRRLVDTQGSGFEGVELLLGGWVVGSVLVFAGIDLTLCSVRALYREKARREADLTLAHEIQSRFAAPVSAKEEAFAVYAETRAAAEVGGDLFEVHRIGRDRVVVAVGDVSGHGAGAGLLMAMVKGALRAELRHTTDLEALARLLNEVVMANADRRHFVTFCAVAVDFAEGRAQVVNAGHLPLLRVRSGEGVAGRINPVGPGLGLMADPPLSVTSVEVAPGDTLLLVSDGLIETTDAAGAEFGLEGVQAVLEARRDAPTAAVGGALFEAARAFGGVERFKDDATVPALRCAAPAAGPGRVRPQARGRGVMAAGGV